MKTPFPPAVLMSGVVLAPWQAAHVLSPGAPDWPDPPIKLAGRANARNVVTARILDRPLVKDVRIRSKETLGYSEPRTRLEGASKFCKFLVRFGKIRASYCESKWGCLGTTCVLKRSAGQPARETR